MSNDNRISAILSAADKAAVLVAFQTIKTKQPLLIYLTPAGCQSIPTLGATRGGMDEAFATAMAAHPELVPGFVDVPEMQKDRTLWLQLGEILQLFAEVCAVGKADEVSDPITAR